MVEFANDIPQVALVVRAVTDDDGNDRKEVLEKRKVEKKEEMDDGEREIEVKEMEWESVSV